MATTDAEIKLQVLLLTVHAIMFLALSGWCLSRLRDGRWAAMGAVGAGLLGLASGLQAASALENVFWETSHIANEVLIRGHVFTVLYAAEALGAILVAGAFAESRRTPPSTSIYGA